MGWPELVLILIVLLVIFGAGKLPQVGSAIGRGIRELRSEAEAPDPVPPAGDTSTERQADRPESRA